MRRRALLRGLGATLMFCAGVGCPSSPSPEPESWGVLPPLVAPCVGDGDGVLTGSEIPAIEGTAGAALSFVVNAPGRAVALPAGWLVEDASGFVVDLGLDLLPADPVDTVIVDGPATVSGAWFADRIAGQWQALLDAESGTRGVFSRGPDDAGRDTVFLHGIASEEAGETALRYEPPVALFPLPLRVGDAWEVAADAVGLADGVEVPDDRGADGVVSLIHRYRFTVDGAGTVRVPAADRPALRLRLVLRAEAYNSVAGLFAVEASRATFLLAECVGVVARLRSQSNELDLDFTTAREVLRWGLAEELLP